MPTSEGTNPSRTCLPHPLQERGIRCACERCSEPLHTSTDRYLEGVWCLQCTTDVLVAVSAAGALVHTSVAGLPRVRCRAHSVPATGAVCLAWQR